MSYSYDMANERLNGDLDGVLRRGRSRGRSIRQIRDDLANDRIYVSIMTVYRWCQRLGIDTSRKAS